jgi:hypothetical protein
VQKLYSALPSYLKSAQRDFAAGGEVRRFMHFYLRREHCGKKAFQEGLYAALSNGGACHPGAFTLDHGVVALAGWRHWILISAVRKSLNRNRRRMAARLRHNGPTSHLAAIGFSSLIGCSFVLEGVINPENANESLRYH